MEYTFTSTTLLSSIQAANTAMQEVGLSHQPWESLESVLSPLTSFLKVSREQALVLAIYAHAGIMCKSLDSDDLLERFGKDFSTIGDLQSIQEQLLQRRFLIDHTDEGEDRPIFLKSLRVASKVLYALSKADPNNLDIKKIENFFDLLEEVQNLIRQRYRREMRTEALLSELNSLLHKNQSIPEVKWLISHSELPIAETCLILKMCIELVQGSDCIDLNDVLKELFDSTRSRIGFKRSINDGSNWLVKHEWLEFSEGELFTSQFITLGEVPLSHLLGGFKDMKASLFKPKMGHVVDPNKIAGDQLRYNPKELQQLETISGILEASTFAAFLSRMEARGLPSSLTILLHGAPGTGKTSSVHQLARNSGRMLFQVDIDKVLSKWVGESEKNIAKVFREYQILKENSSLEPILLFNEADAILGRRIHVRSSTDQMNNTMQNILLQALEDFTGIFIATTNLVNNLDPAFERRILYKIEFKLPEPQIRMEILKDAFQELDASLLVRLNNAYTLSGGQIKNLKKKVEVELLLKGRLPDDHIVFELCSEELALQELAHGQPIGFHRP